MMVRDEADMDRAAPAKGIPEQVLQSIVDGINSGDLEALMSRYEGTE